MPQTKTTGLFPDRVRVVKEFTADGKSDFFNLGDHQMKNWALQVYGLDANDNLVAPTAWIVWLVGTLVLGTDIGTELVGHNSGGATPQKNGDVAWGTNVPVSGFFINVSGLTLGGAAKIVVVAEGTN